MRYHYRFAETKTIHKFGVDISIFDTHAANGFVYEETETGHLEEFYDVKSTYTWFIIEGSGTFVINDEKFEVNPKDLIVLPPNTRIHYFGKMKMVLCTSPAFDPENERHVRDIDPRESPNK